MSSVSPKNDTSVLSKTFTSYQKIIILLLAILQFTIVLDFMILAPLGDILMKSMNMSTKQFGTVVSAYAISACISGIFAAGFADKFDRKKLLLFFYAGFILGTYFCAISYNYETLFIARIITGLFGGVIGSISMAIITDIFSIHQRGKVMGFVQMAFGGSQILGIPIGLVLANYWSWHATFYMVLILAFILGIALVIKLKPLTEHLKLINNKNALQHLLQTIKKKDYRIGFLATALLSMGGFLIMPFSTAFIVNNIHIAQSQVAIIFFFTGIFSIIIITFRKGLFAKPLHLNNVIITNIDEFINQSAKDLAENSKEKNVGEHILLEETFDLNPDDLMKQEDDENKSLGDDNIVLDIEELDPVEEQIKEDPDSLKEVDLSSTLENTLETITLKKPNQVYYQIYQKAREKAKEAKKNAIVAYLDMKNIKKTYMLEDIDESDSEFEDFVSRDSDSDNESLEDNDE